MRILICGKDGSGKTTLAVKLAELTGAIHLNADALRDFVGDKDFSEEGRTRQAKRMRALADFEGQRGAVICDFICPTEETRTIFDADFTIFMNTGTPSKWGDTEAMFSFPKKCDRVFDRFPTEYDISDIVQKLRL